MPDTHTPLPPLPTGAFPPATTSAVRWSSAFKKCLIAGAATTFIVMIAGSPIVILLALPVGGWFGVFLYARSEGPIGMNAGIGARIGAVTGLTTYGMYAVLMAIVLFFQRALFLEEIKKTMRAAAAQNPNPQAQQVVEKLMTPEGIAVLITVSAIFLFFVFLVLCTIGGAIGGSLAKPKTAT